MQEQKNRIYTLLLTSWHDFFLFFKVQETTFNINHIVPYFLHIVFMTFAHMIIFPPDNQISAQPILNYLLLKQRKTRKQGKQSNTMI